MYRIYKDGDPLNEFYRTRKAAQMVCACYNVKYQYCTIRSIFEAIKVKVNDDDVNTLRQERLKEYRHQYVYIFVETVKDDITVDISLQEPSTFFDPTAVCAFKNGGKRVCFFCVPQLWLDEQTDVENWCISVARKAWEIMMNTRWKQIHQSEYRVTKEGEVERYENNSSCNGD